MVLSIDPSRVSDPEIAAEGERQALLDLSRRFSGEDLMRAFDALTRAEYEIRGSMQPRYHLEMALLRWVHLRKLTPLADLIKQVEGGTRPVNVPAPARAAAPAAPLTRSAPAGSLASQAARAVEQRRAAPPAANGQPPAASRKPDAESRTPAAESRTPDAGGRKPEGGSRQPQAVTDPATLKEAFLEEVRKQKKFFYGTVAAQAQRIELQPDAITFYFAPQHKALRVQLEQTRALLESIASELAGRAMAVRGADGVPSSPAPAKAGSGGTSAEPPSDVERSQELKDRAMADNSVQAMLDVFAAEIKDVEEM
jgi:DNA polymerase-3 subunit gamma/tau